MSPPRSEWAPLPFGPDDLVERVLARAVTDPDLVAVVPVVGEPLTYGEIVERAASLAPILRAADGGFGVSIVTDHDAFGPIAVVAAWSVGCRLALLDVADPPARTAALARLIGAPVLARPHHGAYCAELDVPTSLCPDGGASVPTELRNGTAEVVAVTSGSTAAPKAMVLGPGRWRIADEHDSRACRRSQLLSGGVGTYPYLNAVHTALSCGGTVVMSDSHTGSVDSLVDLVRRHDVSFVSITPTLARAVHRVVGGVLSDRLQQVNLRGERVTGDDLAAIRLLAPSARIRLNYASTEVGPMVTDTYLPDQPLPEGTVALTERSGGIDLRLLGPDGTLGPAAPGTSGELVVDGPVIFDGYLGVPDGGRSDWQVVGDDGRRWVRTGDLVEFDQRGALVVIGRTGRRVKVSGLFVDLDEVATVLEQHPDVTSAAVTSFDDDVRTWLVGHLVTRPGVVADPVAIRGWAVSRLAFHMVPPLVRIIDDLPLNASGKTDHLALGAWRPPAAVVDERATSRHLADVPEALVLAVAARLAGRAVDLDTDLVEAGLSSIDWLELVETLGRSSGTELEVLHVLADPTPRGIARLLVGGVGGEALTELSSGRRAPTVVWAMLGLAAQEALPLARSLRDRAVVLPTPRGFSRPGRRATTVDRIVGDMAEAIESTLEPRALVLVGFSTGCVFAQDLAALLLRRGWPVALLVQLDPVVPERPSARRRVVRLLRVLRDRVVVRSSSRPLDEVHRALFRLQLHATRRHVRASFPGPTLVVRSEQHADRPLPTGMTGPVDTVVLPGTRHHDVAASGAEVAGLIEEMLTDGGSLDPMVGHDRTGTPVRPAGDTP